jgi:hypothetical protein
VGKALFWINGGIEGFDVMHLCKLCIIMENLAGGRNKSNLAMIVKLLLIKVLKGQCPAQTKFANCVITMAGLGLN